MKIILDIDDTTLLNFCGLVGVLAKDIEKKMPDDPEYAMLLTVVNDKLKRALEQELTLERMIEIPNLLINQTDESNSDHQSI